MEADALKPLPAEMSSHSRGSERGWARNHRPELPPALMACICRQAGSSLVTSLAPAGKRSPSDPSPLRARAECWRRLRPFPLLCRPGPAGPGSRQAELQPRDAAVPLLRQKVIKAVFFPIISDPAISVAQGENPFSQRVPNQL